MRALIRAVLLLAVANVVGAQGRWKEIGKTITGNPVFVDPGSVKTVNGIITARIRVKFTTPVDAKPGVKWFASHHIAMFDCAKSKVAAKESLYYGDAGETKVVERQAPAQPGYGVAMRGAMTEVALNYLCKKS